MNDRQNSASDPLSICHRVSVQVDTGRPAFFVSRVAPAQPNDESSPNAQPAASKLPPMAGARMKQTPRIPKKRPATLFRVNGCPKTKTPSVATQIGLVNSSSAAAD